MTTASYYKQECHKTRMMLQEEHKRHQAMEAGLAQRNRELQNIINYTVNMIEDKKPHEEIFVNISRYRR